MAPVDHRLEIISKVCIVAKSSKIEGDKNDLIRFIDAFYTSVALEALVDVPVKTLLSVAQSMWQFSEKRKPGTALVRVFNPTEKKEGWSNQNTVIQIVNDNMPFLVDSVTAGLNVVRRLGIRTLNHPMILVERKTNGERIRTSGRVGYGESKAKQKECESFIFIEIDTRLEGDELSKLCTDIHSILGDVRLAVEDWPAMVERVKETAENLGQHISKKDNCDAEETKRFISWLLADNFTFLGYREYRFKGDPRTADFKATRGSGLGLLRNSNRHILRGAKGFAAISPEIREFLSLPDPIIITKANVKTQVHRPVHLDYIGVKMFDKDGAIVGERRFVGLFTSASYSRRSEDIPIIRRKLTNVQKRSGHETSSHAGKALLHILDTYPRDELFQISENQLLEMCLGIQHLMERPRAKVFIRRDKFERFVSALVYVPRENYNSALRNEIGSIIANAYNGEISVYYAQLSDVSLARWHFIIRTNPGDVPHPDIKEINIKVEAAAKLWSQHLKEKLMTRIGVVEGARLGAKYENVFPMTYREAFWPHRACNDVVRLEEIKTKDDIVFEIYRLLEDPKHSVRLKIIHASKIVALSDCLPILENLGLRVIAEHAYSIRNEFAGCIHDFYMEDAASNEIDIEVIKKPVEDLLGRVWFDKIEGDSLNSLTIRAGLSGEQIVVLRAYVKYLRQIGLPFSQKYVNSCMVKNSEVSLKLIQLFEVLFDPAGDAKKERLANVKKLSLEIRKILETVTSLDEDRILRSFLSVTLATVRTNFYQASYANGDAPGGHVPGLALKIRSRNVEMVPEPKPFAEIFVYSPRYEGVHLRGGAVARGGLRWSDRPEDFRTEILGLAKAQMVKNSVIVPVGAKGGFVPKKLDASMSREEFMGEGVACYKSFISSLLSVTDNLKGGRAIPPKRVVRWDKSDPYLVVAADKGTATFSDIANSIAIDYGFWLGDAFASGGSIGYDHKKMGITARGGWVSVERHFRELGINVAKDPVSVIGIGDMSGDVFGNGMLLSRTLLLNVAFDHRHIFFDPNPNPEKSFNERKRLFKLPRSSWADYSTKLISEGGGVFERSAKSIPLNKEFKKFLGVDDNSMTPNELLNCILKAKADLLWIGGIGTYVKATSERNIEVGDRANDTLRVSAKDLGVRVIGEGGNLGMTQKARIEFARAGGRLNTDFVDNSAGVDCSDKEVNIKILLADAMAVKMLTEKERVKTLSRMTKDVGLIVLEDNYLQTQAISIAEKQALKARDQHAGLIRLIEREGRLNREIEGLPSDEQFLEMSANQQGLTRPELAVVVSYAKMSLYDVLLPSALMDNPILQTELEWGFPTLLRNTYAKQLSRHQLRHEIIATTLANEVINRGGMTFVYDIKEETGLAVDQIAAAFLVVRDVFNLNSIWADIDKLDYKVLPDVQMEMHIGVCNFLRNQTIWYLHNSPNPLDITKLIKRFTGGVKALFDKPEDVLSPLALEIYKAHRHQLKAVGVPNQLAKTIACLEVMGSACDIVNVSDTLSRPVADVGTAYFDVGHRIGFDWLRKKAEDVSGDDRWDSLAVHSILDDLAKMQSLLTKKILTNANGSSGTAAVAKWIGSNAVVKIRAERLLSDLKSSGPLTVAKISFAARHIRSILGL
jgi:glutamate dehydrogenase